MHCAEVLNLKGLIFSAGFCTYLCLTRFILSQSLSITWFFHIQGPNKTYNILPRVKCYNFSMLKHWSGRNWMFSTHKCCLSLTGLLNPSDIDEEKAIGQERPQSVCWWWVNRVLRLERLQERGEDWVHESHNRTEVSFKEWDWLEMKTAGKKYHWSSSDNKIQNEGNLWEKGHDRTYYINSRRKSQTRDKGRCEGADLPYISYTKASFMKRIMVFFPVNSQLSGHSPLTSLYNKVFPFTVPVLFCFSHHSEWTPVLVVHVHPRGSAVSQTLKLANLAPVCARQSQSDGEIKDFWREQTRMF